MPEMDSNNYVAENKNGGYDVFLGGKYFTTKEHRRRRRRNSGENYDKYNTVEMPSGTTS